MFHSFSIPWLGRGTCLSFRFLLILPCAHFSKFSFLLIITRGVCASHSPGLILGREYIICSYGQISIFQGITLSTQSCLVLYSFCANLLHSLIMWLIVSYLYSHNLHRLFFLVLSILDLIWLVLMALFCAAIWRNSVSLLSFLFHIHVHVFSREMSFVSRLKRP